MIQANPQGGEFTVRWVGRDDGNRYVTYDRSVSRARIISADLVEILDGLSREGIEGIVNHDYLTTHATSRMIDGPSKWFEEVEERFSEDSD